jgi:hypothetical protein
VLESFDPEMALAKQEYVLLTIQWQPPIQASTAPAPYLRMGVGGSKGE